MNTTCIRNPKTFASPKSMIELLIYAERITMETFTKLLITNIVPSKCSGFVNKLSVFFEDGVFFDFIILRSVGEREKKATSDPEINAEQSKRISNRITQTMITESGVSIVTCIFARWANGIRFPGSKIKI